MFTEEQMVKMFEEEKENLIKLGVPISDDICPAIRFSKATSWYGMCESNRVYNGKLYKFRICLTIYLANSDERGIRNTIIHELLHTCPGCGNHGPKWKSWAGLVKSKLGYDIKTRGGDKGVAYRVLEEARVKKYGKGHLLVCKGCGREYKRSRHSNLTLHPELYSCHCGGDLELKY